jgi:hypothetical protein
MPLFATATPPLSLDVGGSLVMCSATCQSIAPLCSNSRCRNAPSSKCRAAGVDRLSAPHRVDSLNHAGRSA